MKGEFKALWVKPKTHQKVRIEAAKRGKTVDQVVNLLLKGTPTSN